MKATTFHTLAAIAVTFSVGAVAATMQPGPMPSTMAASSAAASDTLVSPGSDSFLDQPTTPGSWFYRQVPGQTRAVFGSDPDDATFMMFCDIETRDVILVRADNAAMARPTRIRTETRERLLTMAPPQPESRLITARLAASDPLLDAMAITKGRFAVETDGLASLYIPSWVEVTRVIEDCR